jgi:hypothetical protein
VRSADVELEVEVEVEVALSAPGDARALLAARPVRRAEACSASDRLEVLRPLLDSRDVSRPATAAVAAATLGVLTDTELMFAEE